MQRFGVQVLEQLKSLQSCSKRKIFKIPIAVFPASIFFIVGFASSAEVARHRSELFSAEQSRQRENVGRMEKIEVRYLGVPNDETFVLNKNLSTPYDIARRKHPLAIISRMDVPVILFNFRFERNAL